MTWVAMEAERLSSWVCWEERCCWAIFMPPSTSPSQLESSWHEKEREGGGGDSEEGYVREIRYVRVGGCDGEGGMAKCIKCIKCV